MSSQETNQDDSSQKSKPVALPQLPETDVVDPQAHPNHGGDVLSRMSPLPTAEGTVDGSAPFSPMMMEQDADLLESMHYASSQVSQYSPGGTPAMHPIDRSLPVEDLSLLPAAVATASPMVSRALLSQQSGGGAGFLSTDGNSRSFLPSLGHSLDISSKPQGPVHRSLLRRDSEELQPDSSITSISEPINSSARTTGTPDDRSTIGLESSSTPQESSFSYRNYRRCLSGEVRKVQRRHGEQEEEDGGDDNGGEEGTTASPIGVAQETETTMQSEKQREESGKAEQRRFNEARQFAEAVGERIGVRRGDELLIIEDHEDDYDDDEEESLEMKEIHIDSAGNEQGSHDELHVTMDGESRPPSVVPTELESDPTGILSQPPTHVAIQTAASKSTENYSRRKFRPAWPFHSTGVEPSTLWDQPEEDYSPSTEVVYKGICANPPEITKRGIQRGNYAQLHRKAWLEVSDKYHRYGKNLRLYYREWTNLGYPTNQFFDWLDSKGEAAGEPLPNLEECPRSVLDADTVLYINDSEVTERYALDIICGEDGRGRIVDVDGDPVLTGPDGWIFVLRDNVMYGAEKVASILGHSKQRFHHSSFFGGKAVASAGILLTDEEGYLVRLYPHSGHYRPGEAHMQRMLYFIYKKGVDLRTFEMDTQQFRHVAREKEKGKGEKAEKKKKVDSLHLEKAVIVACFLAHKASFIRSGVFDMIHKIRKADVTSVSEALEMVDGDGQRRGPRREVEFSPEPATVHII